MRGRTLKTPRKLPPSEPRTEAGSTVPLTVVGIGASAGGLKALQQFVAAVSPESDAAFVVILHLDPDRQSRMRELLQDRTSLPVTEVSGRTKVERNHIYMIPPDRDLAMRNDVLELRPRGDRSDHAPVDLFFRTLAESVGSEAVGVVLSGTGSDGTAGIRYIREAGGITVAQLPDEAEYDAMPTSAISTGLVDLVLPAAQIAPELMRLRRAPRLHADGDGSAPEADTGLPEVLATLRARTGHDFSLYKRSPLARRLERRLRFNQVKTLAEYEPLLQASAHEAQALLRDLLISVSSFFRDPDAFEALAAHTPSLFDGKSSADAVRVWVVGCATGEEVYSIAMVLAEAASLLPDPPRLQLFATDIDEHGYTWARTGFYPTAAVSGVSPERLRRFFTKEAGGYRIDKSVRELVLFAGHNVLHDPPFSRMDLVSCRNLFIYLQPEAQERILETFHFALNPGGLLLLGASESTGESPLFDSDGTAQQLYRRRASSQRIMPRVSAADPQPGAAVAAMVGPRAPEHRPESFSYGSLHVRMLEEYAPASLVVDDRLDLVHLSPNAARYLRLNEGEPSHKVLLLAPAELSRALRTALHHAFQDGASSSRRVTVPVPEGRQQVRLHVRPSPDALEGGRRFALVVFEPGNLAIEEELAALTGPELELEDELRRTRAQLEATSSAHDRTVAELQTLNEELQSINEEQRAATEELETGREEIQSINEELTTINQEHQSTIEELRRTNGDLQNLIESTEIGTIFLDRDSRVRRFTPAVATLFNFIAADQGRPLAHVTHRLHYDELLADVSSVLASHARLEREVDSDTGKSFIVRISPYRSLDGELDGVVLTFFDNTTQHDTAVALREAIVASDSANLAKSTFLSTLSHEFRTPLNAILGYADLLLMEGALDAAQSRKVERIKVGGWHLAAMIEEILSFAKLDGGHEAVDAAPIDARIIANEAAALVEPAAGMKRLSFVVDLPGEPVPLVTDGPKARQILVNLCGNAIKYTETGEVRLRVRTNDGHAIFEVRDSGIGIAPEHLTRIFERFWQVDGASTRAAGGLGIGLAAAREYARLLGGDVTVRSEHGVGSTFQLQLPVT